MHHSGSLRIQGQGVIVFTQNRDQLRQFFLQSWQKLNNQQPLEPLEALVAGVVADHPEYHSLIESGDDALGREYTPEQGQTNPFLHMGMHITIREQVQTDRPAGIAALHQQLVMKTGDTQQTEHLIMECLGTALWEAQRSSGVPDEASYLECLRNLL
jgi:hypothetical protein